MDEYVEKYDTVDNIEDIDENSIYGWMKREKLIASLDNDKLRKHIVDDILEELCRSAVKYPRGMSKCVYIIGSSGMMVHSNHSDMDILCTGPADITHHQFFKNISNLLDGDKRIKLVHVAMNAKVPLARMIIHNIDIEMSYCNVMTPWTLNEKDIRQLNQQSYRSISGILDCIEYNRCINNKCSKKEEAEMAQNTVRCIKAWAEKRGITNNASSYIGGFSYSLLVLHSLNTMKGATIEQCIKNFFKVYDNRDWSQPLKKFKSISSKNLSSTPPKVSSFIIII